MPVSILNSYSLPDDIPAILAIAQQKGEVYLTKCLRDGSLDWPELAKCFVKILSGYIITARHGPERFKSELKRGKIDIEGWRDNFQEMVICAASACVIAEKLRSFTDDQPVILNAIDVVVEPPASLSPADGKPKASLSVKNFYLQNSGGPEASIHSAIINWLPMLMEHNPDESGKEYTAVVELRKMFPLSPVDIKAAASATTSLSGTQSPISREAVASGKAGWREFASLRAGSKPAA